MLDMDIGLRSLDLIFGTQKDVLFDWGNVIDGGCEPNQAALAAGGPMLMTAPMRMSDSFTKENMKELADKLAKDYDYIFLTLGGALRRIRARLRRSGQGHCRLHRRRGMRAKRQHNSRRDAQTRAFGHKTCHQPL